MEIRYTLISDGSSDRALMPILNWLLKVHLNDYPVLAQWADLRRLDKSLRNTLEKRIQLSIHLYPCDLLFIHRDAEKTSYETRLSEIHAAVSKASSRINVPTVSVVPVHMTEAWLIFDVIALRKAAANPNGKNLLNLPNIQKLENEPDPKELLYNLLRQASGRSSRRLKSFSLGDCVHRVAELIDDFSPLRNLPAFAALESEVQGVIKEKGW